MKVFIGADHRGFALKEQLKTWLVEAGHDVTDCGNVRYDKDDDYPDFTFAVAENVVQSPQSRGIVICGSGGGVTVAANKIAGIRCTVGVDVWEVKHNRGHNDINVLSVGADHTTPLIAKKLIIAFMETPFEPKERFVRRLRKIAMRENSKQ